MFILLLGNNPNADEYELQNLDTYVHIIVGK